MSFPKNHMKWISIHNTHTHTHQTVDPSSPILPTLLNYLFPLVTTILFYLWVCFCFLLFVGSYFVSDILFHIWVKSYSICLWLTSLSVMPWGSILVTDGKISFFMAVNIGIYLLESVFPCSLEKIPRSRVAGSCSVLFLIFWGNPYYFL